MRYLTTLAAISALSLLAGANAYATDDSRSSKIGNTTSGTHESPTSGLGSDAIPLGGPFTTPGAGPEPNPTAENPAPEYESDQTSRSDTGSTSGPGSSAVPQGAFTTPGAGPEPDGTSSRSQIHGTTDSTHSDASSSTSGRGASALPEGPSTTPGAGPEPQDSDRR